MCCSQGGDQKQQQGAGAAGEGDGMTDLDCCVVQSRIVQGIFHGDGTFDRPGRPEKKTP
jgi:hypothetical protein